MVKSGVGIDEAVKTHFGKVGKTIKGFKFDIQKSKDAKGKDIQSCVLIEDSIVSAEEESPFQKLMTSLDDTKPWYVYFKCHT